MRDRRSFGGWTRAAIITAALVMAGCTPQPSTVTTSPPERGVFPPLRTCDSASFGRPTSRDAVRIGPLTLVGTAQPLPPSTFEPHLGRYTAIEVLALVTGTDDVTVTVPLSERDSLFLLYDPDARGNEHGFPVAAGAAQVRFEACAGTEPRYVGGVLATEPGCAELEVGSEGSGLVRGWINLGGRSPCSDGRS